MADQRFPQIGDPVAWQGRVWRVATLVLFPPTVWVERDTGPRERVPPELWRGTRWDTATARWIVPEAFEAVG